ncbi:anti-sigma-I factor RsgI family protein [Acidaminobacter sp.]|uniref:anti-sigma-I factor RsgI family protein n=1 Tax=Acidaminobacter sp. TaxID=1872102 RepID=UPI00256B379A|nr:hypothetical protein [Acidaminobacter sp.]MDK9711499.1 hypothetical protein [Acidaminobacter sp.]
MKAVITEIRGAKAAVLQDDGSIRLLENKNYKIGQVVELKTTKWYNNATKWVAAAAAVLMITSGAASYAYLNPVATVSLDVNPSIEFRVNSFDKVISVKAMNDDGEQILEELDMKGMDIEKAIEAALDEMVEQKFLDEDDDKANVMISVMHKNETKQEEMTVYLNGEVNVFVKNAGIEAEVEVEGIGADRVELAADFNEKNNIEYTLTPGKLNLLEKLNAAQGNEEKLATVEDIEVLIGELIDRLNDVSDDDEPITLEDLTVKDIMKEIKRNRLDVDVLPEDQAKDKGNEAADGEDVVENDKGKPESALGLEGKDKEDKSPNENANENGNGSNAGGKNGGN